MRTIAVMNQKGGCGKTTVAINLAGAFAQLDRRILLIDLDPQAHASIGMGINNEEQQTTTWELLLDPAVTLTDAIFTINNQLHVVPSSTVLSGIEQELSDKAGREERLRPSGPMGTTR